MIPTPGHTVLHDSVASTVALARSVREGLPDAVNTTMATATLRHLLDTLIDLGAQPFLPKQRENLARTVMGQTVSLQKAREAAEKVLEAEQSAMDQRFHGG